jgi:hypothetical protein
MSRYQRDRLRLLIEEYASDVRILGLRLDGQDPRLYQVPGVPMLVLPLHGGEEGGGHVLLARSCTPPPPFSW